jgi:hypothetical protein
LCFSKLALFAPNDGARDLDFNFGIPRELFSRRILLYQFSLPLGRVFGHGQMSARLGEL